MPPQRGALRLLSLNVNGLSGPDKVARLCTYLVSGPAGDPDVVILQELKLASRDVTVTVGGGQTREGQRTLGAGAHAMEVFL